MGIVVNKCLVNMNGIFMLYGAWIYKAPGLIAACFLKKALLFNDRIGTS